jgi:hypothetical protein
MRRASLCRDPGGCRCAGHRRSGIEWWVLEACDPGVPFAEDLLEFATRPTARFTPKLHELIDKTPCEHLQHWEICDRPPIRQ